jgi:uracil phosphoribosyltransferase
MPSRIFNLSKQLSVANQFMAELRDAEIQTDPMRFRKNLERLSEILAYEISKTLSYKSLDVSTPLGTKSSADINEDIVVISILRAGLALHQGFMSYFDVRLLIPAFFMSDF